MLESTEEIVAATHRIAQVEPTVRPYEQPRTVWSYVNKQTLPFFQIVLISAILLSVFSAWIFIRDGFHISHFDAKGHQLVARRVLDNLQPGLKQLGAFWLPLPHVIYLPFVYSDYLYFHGLAGTPVSMICFVITVLLLFKIIEKLFDPFSAFCGSVLYLTNPNMLYLQTTALSENLSIVFLVASAYAFVLWSSSKQRKTLTWASLLSALGVLCRYENWPAAILLGLLVIAINLKDKRATKDLLYDCAVVAAFNVGAMAFSFWMNWWTTGHIYIDIDYKRTDYQPAKGSLFIAFFVAMYTLGNLISYDWTLIAVIAFFMLAWKRRKDSAFLASLMLLGPLLIYLYAYADNHPTRIRYGLMFVPAAVCYVSAWANRSRLFTYLFLVFGVYMALFSPFHYQYSSQLLKESLRDADNLAIEEDLSTYLLMHDDGRPILISMGELAPLIYDLRLPIRRFVHEGSKPYWNDAYTYGHPEKVVGWVYLSLDDQLWKKFHDSAEFHKHFKLIGRRNYIELYQQTSNEDENIKSHPKHGFIDKFGPANIPGI